MTQKKKCYWFSQGKCQIAGFPEYMVYGILSRVPEARETLLSCTASCVVSQDYLDFASNPRTLVEPADVTNAKFKDHVTEYRDNSRLRASNPTTPKSHLDDE